MYMYVHLHVGCLSPGWLAGFQLAGWPILLVGWLAGWIRGLLAGLSFLTFFNFFNFFNLRIFAISLHFLCFLHVFQWEWNQKN